MNFADLKKNRKSAFENLQKQLKSVNERSYKDEDDANYWQPGKDAAGNGYAIIRFLPSNSESGNDFIRTYSYGFQGPTGKWYIEKSLNTINKDDPVGDLNRKLWNSGIESNKDIVRKRKRRTKFVSNVYVIKDRENPDAEGKVWLYAHPKTVYDMYNDLMYPEGADDDDDIKAINPFDMWEGSNFRLSVKKNDQGWPDYGKSKFDNQSEFLSSDEEREAVYNMQHSLDELVNPANFKTYEELEAKLKEVLNGEAGSGHYSEEDDKNDTAEEKTLVKSEPKEEKTSFASEKTQEFSADDDNDDEEDALAVFRNMKR